MKIKREKTGFTLIEISLTVALLLIMGGVTVGGVTVYTAYKAGTVGGQKLRTTRQLIRVANANRLTKDAPYISNGGRGNTVLELVNNGDFKTVNQEYEGAEAIIAVILESKIENGTIQATREVQDFLANLGNEVLASAKLTSSQAFEDSPVNNKVQLSIVNGIPAFSDGVKNYDPSPSKTDGIWDSGPFYIP